MAYTTVKTLLSRLVEKGALSEDRQANVNIYEPRITRNEARGSALRSLLDRAFDGTFGSLFQHLIAEERLSERDVRTLERMLQDADRDASAAPTPRPTPTSAPRSTPTPAPAPTASIKTRRSRTIVARSKGGR